VQRPVPDPQLQRVAQTANAQPRPDLLEARQTWCEAAVHEHRLVAAEVGRQPIDRGAVHLSPADLSLGLAVVAAVVKEHRGRIAVDSHPGRGTCFTIHLPGVGPVSKREDSPADASGQCVLIHLADTYTEQLLISALEANGLRVCTVAAEQTLKDAVSAVSPDAVLLDAGLSACSRRECLHAAQGVARPVPVLFIGDPGGESLEDIGADVSVLNRPFLISDVIRLIHNLASHHGTG